MTFNLFDISNLKASTSLVLDIDKNSFVTKFSSYIDTDRGYLVDELTKSSKPYLGSISSNDFWLRKKRKFLRVTTPANASAKIMEIDGKTHLNINIVAYDFMTGVALFITPIFSLILFSVIIYKKAYPALIVFIPVIIGLLIFQRIVLKSMMVSFKNELIKKLNAL